MREEFRRLFSKEDAIPPKVVEAVSRGHRDFVSCRNCGYGLSNSGVASENYCPNCGQRVKHAAYAGQYGWKKKDADAEWHRMLEERGFRPE